MQYRTFSNAIVATFLTLTSAQALAGATATAQVTANIVPTVSASVTGSVVLQTRAHNSVPVSDSVSLSTGDSNDPARFKIRNSANYDYVVTVASELKTAEKAAPGTMQLTRTRLPAATRSADGEDSQELSMKASLTTGQNQDQGAYNGSVYITANFN